MESGLIIRRLKRGDEMSSREHLDSKTEARGAGATPATEAAHCEDLTAVEVSVVMPCLNEADTLATCIRKARRALSENNITGEVVVADNGSSDASQEIALENGARLVPVEAKGYGNALMGGIAAARGRY